MIALVEMAQLPMSVINRAGLFTCVVAFSSAMVMLSARDLLRGLKAPTDTQTEQVKQLIHQLRGDQLFKIEAKYDQEHDKPNRKPGSVLPDYDIAKIKKFLSNLIGGVGSDSADEPTVASDSDSK